MEVIPVVDLKGGAVVRARMGRRDEYRPIVTPLSRTSDAVDVTRGLLSLYPFSTLYVADLDAIEGAGDHSQEIARVHAAFPQLTLWVDNGIANGAAAQDWLDGHGGRLVLGSERQTDHTLVRELRGNDRVVLSLDFGGDTFQGPPSLLHDPALWPRDIIVMTLARVGSGAGPDLGRIETTRRAAPGARIYAAGGVRNAADLAALEQAGVAGALVASCLHDGTLTRSDLEGV
jgi:phosphoribosylformimino-5-aminoimidazole carboxamide ribotide isomerase